MDWDGDGEISDDEFLLTGIFMADIERKREEEATSSRETVSGWVAGAVIILVFICFIAYMIFK